MHFFILVLVLCFFIFLFSLYFLSHDDFVLLRRDISENSIFNVAFLTAVAGLFYSRLLYVILHPSGNFLNPLYFILFPYFPGLSLLGGVVGAGFFLLLILRSKKMPVERLVDFFTLSFLSCMPVGIIGYFVLSNYRLLSLEVLFVTLSYVSTFVFFAFFILPRFLKGRVNEGNMSLLFLILFSIISFSSRFMGKFSFGIEEVLLIALFVFGLTIFIKKEKLLTKLISKVK